MTPIWWRTAPGRWNSSGVHHAALHQGLHDCFALDPAQNRRVLIQSLAALKVTAALPLIEALIDDDVPGVRGAARSALARR